MRNFLILMLISFVASASATISAGTPIKQAELPKSAQAFISKYFPKDTVKKVEKDNGRRGIEYEVDFTNGAEAEFTSDGNWKKVKAASGTSVPSAIVPPP